MLIREFDSYTKEDDQEYRVKISRHDEEFKCHVTGKFGDHVVDRKFEATGPDAEQQVQEWLFTLDQEVQELITTLTDSASIN